MHQATEKKTREWICPPCGLFFETPVADFAVGGGSGSEQASCPQCGKAASAVDSSPDCPEADATPVVTRYSLGPQLFAGALSGVVLGLVFVAVQWGAVRLLAVSVGTPWHTVVWGANGLFLAGWAFVNLAGLVKPGCCPISARVAMGISLAAMPAALPLYTLG